MTGRNMEWSWSLDGKRDHWIVRKDGILNTRMSTEER